MSGEVTASGRGAEPTGRAGGRSSWLVLADIIRAETAKLVRRPASWLLLAVAVLLSLTFTYLVPYAGRSVDTTRIREARGLSELLPAELVGNSIAGLPVFFGALMLILGVLATGGEYAWGTWKTLLAQGPSRWMVYLGKVLALCGATLANVLAVFAAGAATSAGIAAGEGQRMDWPPVTELLVGFGAGWLIATMWAMLGTLLAILLRGVALPVGLGLVWMLAVQNLLAAIAAPLLAWVADLQRGMPGPNAGSLAAALGASAETPGVAQLVGGGQGALVVAAYLLGFAILAGVLLARRDIV